MISIFFDIEFEKLPKFYDICDVIGHGSSLCRRKGSENKAQTMKGEWNTGWDFGNKQKS